MDGPDMNTAGTGAMEENSTGAMTTDVHENSWVISIKHELQHLATTERLKSKSGNACTIFRVRGQVRKVKADHFDPELMFLGLFHRDRYSNPEVNKFRGDKFRLEMTNAFLKIVRADDWERLCAEVVDDPWKVQLCYSVDEPDLKLIQCTLTLDAIFLASYLLGYLFLQDPDVESKFPFSLEPFREIVSEEGLSFHNIVANDITKLENQIPLYLIKRVLDILCRDRPGQWRPAEDDLNEMCYKLVRTISLTIPGFSDDPALPGVLRPHQVNFRSSDHLLGCVCSMIRGAGNGKEGSFEAAGSPGPKGRSISKIFHLHLLAKDLLGRVLSACRRDKKVALKLVSDASLDENNQQRISLPSITKLHEAGIGCRGETRGNSDIDLVPRFQRKLLKATIFIPTFSILHRTELLWRNMVAYESETTRLEDNRVSQFIYFLKFMDELVNTDDDVSLLRKGRHPVIPKNLLGTEKDVAELFNSIAQHYSVVDARSPRWLELRTEIVDFYNMRYRRMALEFLRFNFGKPWLVISILAATILLVLTFLQTIYTVLAFYPSS